LRETAGDIERLQALLDRSFERSGSHLRSIFTEERRVGAAELPAMLPGVQILSLATVTAACEPRVAPVDGHFYRGELWFGSSHDSLRFRNIRSRPQVSAAITRGEEFALIAHGVAHEVDLNTAELEPFRSYLREVYSGDESWDDWGADAAYARLEARTMFSFREPPLIPNHREAAPPCRGRPATPDRPSPPRPLGHRRRGWMPADEAGELIPSDERSQHRAPRARRRSPASRVAPRRRRSAPGPGARRRR
jgi:hypothetical protein